MHNCQSMKDELAQIVLGEPADQAKAASVELNECPHCREELAALQSVLHVSRQAMKTPVVEENFWPGYHERLRSKLVSASEESIPASPVFWSRGWRALKSFATSSIQLPVPAAVALMILLGIAFVVAARRGGSNNNPMVAGVIHDVQTVEVPVLKEKVVTRVLYLEKTRPRRRPDAVNSDLAVLNGVAVARTAKPALSLIGFKPTDQVKLTIIKEKYQDEK